MGQEYSLGKTHPTSGMLLKDFPLVIISMFTTPCKLLKKADWPQSLFSRAYD